ncbi:probable glycosyl transferase [Phialocephala subalpina]|uniref:Probable glycosyl transferase n=1 Tax=Phialocephala subalpina TaxID=576137 RepID=A0A1L7XWB8_9HELO|nr:probable glycosyl transferase [Phialocephala subalpina]
MPEMKMQPKLSYGSRLPKQIRRALPVYIAVILFITIISNADSIGSSMKSASPKNLKRSFSSQKILSSGTGKGTQFPKKIWQSWKVDPLNFDIRDSDTAKTWTSKNPGHRYEVLTDNNDLYYVEENFGPNGCNRPDIVETYRSLTAKIIKADLLRYLVMYVEGGVYADIDVEALKPIKRFIPDRYDEGDIDMVISVEIDQPDFKEHAILGKKSQSFCQWTFMCKPRLPMMLKLVDNILAWLNDLSRQQGVPISELHLDFDEVISGTGPSAFTAAVLEAMSKKEGKPVDWTPFHDLNESKLVGGILVLTVEAFAAGQGHSDSGNHNARTALVKHHYHASSWPSNHPRFSHPVYGEVEKCNWDPECVKLWDYNIAVFKNLPEAEQKEQIAVKEAAEKQLADLAALAPPPQLVPPPAI